MPLFTYTAKTKKGENSAGEIEAIDEHEAANTLRSKGLVLLSIKKQGESEKDKKSIKNKINNLVNKIKIFGNVSLVDKMLFSRHLAVMIESGLSLNKALTVLKEQTKNPKFGKIIGKVEQDVRQGESFSQALAKHKKAFSEMYVNMVKVGETSGNLNEVLKILAEQMKKDHELISRVKGAMTYPAVIVVAMLGIGVLMMILVVPKLTQVFDDLKIDLPLSTRFIIGISNFLQNNYILALFIFTGLFLLFKFINRIGIVRSVFHRLYLHIPIFSPLIRKVNSARFARILSALIIGGIAIVESLKIAANTLGNIHFKNALIDASNQVQKGEPLSKGLSKYKNLYTPMVIQMIQVGEETGNLSEILENLADFYEDEIDNTTKNLSSIIEPVLMIVVGIAVGFFAVSMIQPMYSMMSGI